MQLGMKSLDENIINDRRAVCVSLARRFFYPIFVQHRADVIQECMLISLNQEICGLKEYSKYAYNQLYKMARNYGYHRPKKSKQLIPRTEFNIELILEEIDKPKCCKNRSLFINELIEKMTCDYKDIIERGLDV